MKRQLIELAVLCVALFVLVTNDGLFPQEIGAGDFRAYWSASYLLAHGQNFLDPALVLRIEQELAGWPEAFPILTWNPPWLSVLLLPYSFLSFGMATRAWLLTNVTMIGLGSVLLWRDASQLARTRARAWVSLVIAFAFVMTMITVNMGQVNTFVFTGLALFLYFSRKRRDTLAGAGLVLTTVKPHLVYLTLPLLFLGLIRTRQWRTFVGLGLSLAGLIVILFMLRPTWLGEYLQNVGSGRLLDWETPTIGGVFQVVLGWSWVKWSAIVVMPLVAWIFYLRPAPLNWRTLIDLTVLIGIPTAPFGWSYDQILLLIPILRIGVWLVEGAIGRWQTVFVCVVLILANAVAIYQRMQSPSDVYYFWVPWVVAAAYGYCAWERVRSGRVSYTRADGNLSPAVLE